ncbi:nucleoside recognition protein [bacterium]|jgi:spore maturation protein A|nr:nucleoside recognition protein [bacterium]
MNLIWLALVVIGVLVGAATGTMAGITKAVIEAAKTAVELSIGLIGIMALWLGFMRLAEEAGLIQGLARLLKPVMKRLFPDVPPEHPAMGSMLSNMAANMIGLGNSATALGLKAMQDLQTLNKDPKTATNAMVTFLAINTASVTLIPATVIGLRVSAGSASPTSIILPTLIASLFSTIVSVMAAKFFEKRRKFRLPEETK